MNTVWEGDHKYCIYLAFSEPMMGFIIEFNNIFYNSNAGAAMTVQYWNGGSWVSVTSLVDGTAGTEAGSSTSLMHSGNVMWQQQSPAAEFQTKVNQEGPFYWYRIYWSTETYSANYGEFGLIMLQAFRARSSFTLTGLRLCGKIACGFSTIKRNTIIRRFIRP